MGRRCRKRAAAPLLLLLVVGVQQEAAAANEQTVFCNRTGACRRCEARHMHAEACRETGFSEHLSCWPTKDAGTYEIEIKTHRAIDPANLPLKISRSCPPSEAKETGPDAGAQWGAAAAAGAGWVPAAAAVLAAPPEEGGAAASGGGGEQRARHGRGSEYVSVGVVADSMGLVKFTLVMCGVLSGALPVVFWRKRQGLHRGYL